MTLVELLIVIVIIGVLVSSVLVASSALLGKSKTRNTLAVLQNVSDAVEQFKRSETQKPTFTRNIEFKRRYGLYPPDELEAFAPDPSGVPGVVPPARPTGSLAKPSIIVPPPTGPRYATPMRFYTEGVCAAADCPDALEHRDLAALIVAIETQGGEAAAILNKISDRNRSAGVLREGRPAQFLSRPRTLNEQQVNSDWDPEDLQIQYILDDWGIPISYMSQRDFEESREDERRSSNHADWNEASTEIIRLNGGLPLIFSLGPNGKEQASADLISSGGGVTFMDDFEPQAATPENEPHKIDHPANADNVYLNDQLREKLAKGI